MKTLLILVDGMRPDALENVAKAQEYIGKSTYTMHATTVMPSVTLPCHMSLFHSVDPSRHGTTTNTYMPQVRPIDGLCEVLHKYDYTCASFYNWEELRDLSRPGSLVHSYFVRGSLVGWEKANDMVAKQAVEYLNENDTDFAFIYLGYVDEAGHAHGWMGEEYMKAVVHSWKNIDDIINGLKDEYNIIITADHGGHDRHHGTEMPEDMTIPVIMLGEAFEAGKEMAGVSIKDITPTIAKLFGVKPAKEWEGSPL